MWLIFDLDDTLIDTSGSITPLRLEKALDVMFPYVKKEVWFQLYSQLFTINKRCVSASKALKIFAQFHNISVKKCEDAIRIVYHHPLEQDLVVPTLPGVFPLLQALEPYQLFLVSKGDKKIQMSKLKKAGIEPEIFCKIQIDGSCNKKKFYQEIVENSEACIKQTVVIGDRVTTDLLPGKQLGFWTVHMQWGRGVLQDASIADFSIRRPLELLHILNSIKNKAQL